MNQLMENSDSIESIMYLIVLPFACGLLAGLIFQRFLCMSVTLITICVVIGAALIVFGLIPVETVQVNFTEVSGKITDKVGASVAPTKALIRQYPIAFGFGFFGLVAGIITRERWWHRAYSVHVTS